MDRISKLVPKTLNIKLEQAIEDPELKAVAAKEPRVKEVLDISMKLEGVCRNAGMHAAGVVISSVPLRELVPLYVTNKQEIVTQYDMLGLEKLGLLKMDFLGLTTLTIIEEAMKLIQEISRQSEWSSKRFRSTTSSPTKRFFRTASPAAFSSLNRPACRTCCAAISPTGLKTLRANALYRPGPIQGGMIPDFIDRKHGRKPVDLRRAGTRSPFFRKLTASFSIKSR